MEKINHTPTSLAQIIGTYTKHMIVSALIIFHDDYVVTKYQNNSMYTDPQIVLVCLYNKHFNAIKY